jgi:hypothetical protein
MTTDHERILQATHRELQRHSDEIARRDAYAAAEALGANPFLVVPVMCADARTVSTGRAIEVEYRLGSSWVSGSEYLTNLRKDPDFAKTFAEPKKASENRRALAPTATLAPASKNPWLKHQFNLTEQMRIEKADRDLARRLQTAADREGA